MNVVELLLKAEAAISGRVRPRRLLRHVHLEEAPLAIAPLQMAGEPHALWAALVGTDRNQPRLIVAPEPRNRDIAFEALARLADVVCTAVDRAASGPRVEWQTRSQTRSRCQMAPQLLVANRAGVDLLDRLGRRMRPAGFGGHVSVPPRVNVAGGHLGFYAEAARHPGSALVLVATEELARHAVTGQSAVEDAHLGAQLAWWDPALLERLVPGVLGDADPATLHGTDAAARIECTPMGVLTDPVQDDRPLLDLLAGFNAQRGGRTDPAAVLALGADIRRVLGRILLPTWRALWVAHDLLRTLPPAPGADQRWERDLGLFTRHADYLARGGRLASVASATRAVMLLSDWERAQAAVESQEVVEDPLALAQALAAGRAIEGEVRQVDTTHQEPGNGRRVSRPLITLLCPEPCPLPVGTDLWWTERPADLRAEIMSSRAHAGGSEVVLKVIKGMQGRLPATGDRAAFSVYTTAQIPPPALPDQVPWTHVAAAGADPGAVELEDGPSLDVLLMEGTPA